FLLWVIIPQETALNVGNNSGINDLGARFQQVGREIGQITRQPSSKLIILTGVGLIAWGAYYFIRQFVPVLDIWAYSQYLWPALLVIAGVFIIIRAVRKKE
ncbi:MAG: hypothetical protein J7L66_00595, partial [Anaerolineaceae bacterium]|nr:hypothetical protein [Anaerolineaceae bacterium]